VIMIILFDLVELLLCDRNGPLLVRVYLLNHAFNANLLFHCKLIESTPRLDMPLISCSRNGLFWEKHFRVWQALDYEISVRTDGQCRLSETI
jgi:hypothetical protein